MAKGQREIHTGGSGGVKATGDESEGNGKKGNTYREREIPGIEREAQHEDKHNFNGREGPKENKAIIRTIV